MSLTRRVSRAGDPSSPGGRKEAEEEKQQGAEARKAIENISVWMKDTTEPEGTGFNFFFFFFLEMELVLTSPILSLWIIQ